MVLRPRRVLTDKGIRAAGGGLVGFVPVPLTWRGTTRQVCGLYPFKRPSAMALNGAPLGVHQETGVPVCFDHVNAFLAGMIGNPSLVMIARPGTGKSTAASKIMVALCAQGYIPMVPGDTKPDYVDVITKLGGVVRRVSRGAGRVAGRWALNPCDPGGMFAAVRRIAEVDAVEADSLFAEMIARATNTVQAQVEIGRNGKACEDYEREAIGIALRDLYAGSEVEPVLPEVAGFIASRPRSICDLLGSTTDVEYDQLLGPLLRSLRSLLTGSYGSTFHHRVVRPEERPRGGVCVDTSAIPASDKTFLASVLVTTWADAYGQVEADNALAEAGLIEQQLYVLCLDELWRVLQLGGSLAERVNETTRLNRTQGVAQMMISHTINDFAGLGSSTTQGIEERAGAVVIGAVPVREIERLRQIVSLSDAEAGELERWWSETEQTPQAGSTPPGTGKFLIKMGSDAPGIPVQTLLTSVEREWGGQNTNRRWANAPQRGRRSA